MSTRSIFVWDPNIGRRSRVNVKTGKSIRRRADGSELFEDYWTDSGEWTSEEDSPSNNNIVKTKCWKESTRIEEKEDTLPDENLKNEKSVKEQSPIDSEKENAFLEKKQDCLSNITKTRTDAINYTRRDSTASLVKDDSIRVSSSTKRNATNSPLKKDIIKSPTSSKRGLTKHRISECRVSGSISKPSERGSAEKHIFRSRKVLNFSDDEESLHVNKSVHQTNVFSNINNKASSVDRKTEKVSGDVVISRRKSFNFVPVNAEKHSETTSITKKSFGISMHQSVFSDSDDDNDDDEKFSFILTNKDQKTSAHKSSFSSSVISRDDKINTRDHEKVAEKRKSGRPSENKKGYQKKMPLSSDNTDGEHNKSPKKSVTKENKKNFDNSDDLATENISESDNPNHPRKESNRNKIYTNKKKEGTCISKSNEIIMTEIESGSVHLETGDKIHSKRLKSKNKTNAIQQTNCMEDEIKETSYNSEGIIEKISKEGTYISKPNETLKEVDSVSSKTTDKRLKQITCQSRDSAVLQANSVEDEVERIHNSQMVTVEKILKSGNNHHSRREYRTEKTFANNRNRDKSNPNETVPIEIEVSPASVKVIGKMRGSIPNSEKNCINNITPQFISSVENDIEKIHNNSEDVDENPLQGLPEDDIDHTQTSAEESNHPNNVKKRKMTDRLLKEKPKMHEHGKYKNNKAMSSLAKQNKSKKAYNSQKNTSKKTIIESNSENCEDSDKNKNNSKAHNNTISEELEILSRSKQNEHQKAVIEESSLSSGEETQDDLCKSISFQYKNTAESCSLSKAKRKKDEGNLSKKEIQLNKIKDNSRKVQRNKNKLHTESESDHSYLYGKGRAQWNEKKKKDKINRKRKVSPVKQNSVNAAKSKTNITSPPSVRVPTPGVRRSKRVRIQPLEHWRNQRIQYQRSENGYTIKGIEQGFDDEPTIAKWSQNYSIYSKHKSKKKVEKSTKSSDKFDDISIQDLSALASNNIVEEPNMLVPVRCWETEDEILTNVVSVHNSLEWTGMGRLPVSEDDPVAIAVSLHLPNASTGYMRIRAFQEKKLQYLPDNSALYVILYGKLLIQINTSTFVLKTGDTFHVPRGNGYSIKNLRKDEAELHFTIFCSETVKEESEDGQVESVNKEESEVEC